LLSIYIELVCKSTAGSLDKALVLTILTQLALQSQV